MKSITIAESVQLFFTSLQISRSENTRDTYGFAMRAFTALLGEKGINPETTLVSALEEDAVIWFSTALKELSPATEELYLQAVARYYEFLYAEELHSPNLARIRLLIHKVLEFAETLPHSPTETDAERLRNLRVHEICKLRRGYHRQSQQTSYHPFFIKIHEFDESLFIRAFIT